MMCLHADVLLCQSNKYDMIWYDISEGELQHFHGLKVTCRSAYLFAFLIINLQRSYCSNCNACETADSCIQWIHCYNLLLDSCTRSCRRFARWISVLLDRHSSVWTDALCYQDRRNVLFRVDVDVLVCDFGGMCVTLCEHQLLCGPLRVAISWNGADVCLSVRLSVTCHISKTEPDRAIVTMDHYIEVGCN